MQSRRQIQDLHKKQRKSKKSSEKKESHEKGGHLSKKKLKEEFVPHKLKIKKMFSKGGAVEGTQGGHDEDHPGSHNSAQSNNHRDNNSNGSKEEKKQRKQLDAEISKGDIKMRAAIQSYLSVSESEGEEMEETK